jgi:putative nucleotidyltransferase with HDIG domain
MNSLKPGRTGNDRFSKPNGIIGADEGSTTFSTGSNLYKWILGLLLAAILTVLAPENRVFRPIGLPREGDISKTDIIAPFTFFIMKDDAVLEEERRQAATEVLPLFDYDATVLQEQRDRIRAFFQEMESRRGQQSTEGQPPPLMGEQQLTEQTLTLLLDPQRANLVRTEVEKLVQGLLKLGIVPGDSLNSQLPASPVRVRRGDVEYERDPEGLLTEDKARETLLKEARAGFQDDDLSVKATYEIGHLFLKPNLIFNQKETEKRRAETMEAVPTTKGMVLKDEKIIGSHERVTAAALEKIRSLAMAKEDRDRMGRSWSLLYPIAGRLLFNAFVVALLAAYLFFYRPKVFLDNRLLLLLALIAIGQMVITYLVRTAAGASEYLVPIAIAAMLTTILYDAQLGGVMALAVALLFGNLEGFDLATTLVALVVGTAAAYSVTKVRHRREFYRPMVFISLGYIFSIGLIGMMRLTPFSVVVKDFGLGIVSGVSAPVITSGILFIFEGLFHVTTDITLLELSDSNRPLLREMSLHAPGTYHHSINVGYLAEEAAESIGAHSLLARVASYYHDIGKLEKPEYFVENQTHGSRNPHDRLSPSMSSLILTAHIKDGVELAQKARVPKAIVDVIEQHHGTSLMTYFYQKALDQGAGREVQEAYRYPGPKPETKEAAIVMLADVVEATSRTLGEASPSRLKGVVTKIIQDKFAAGELDNCELTLKDLHSIGESFIHVLGGTFHQRVEYPQEEAAAEKELEEPPRQSINENELPNEIR